MSSLIFFAATWIHIRVWALKKVLINIFSYHISAQNIFFLDPTPYDISLQLKITVSILHKSIAGRYRPVRIADGPITGRYTLRKTRLFKYIENFTTNNGNFSDKKF